MRLFHAIKAAVERMPSGLRAATFLCASFSLFTPLSLLPGGTYRIDGMPVEFAEFWRRGGGPLFFAFGVVCACLAYGFLRARLWSRPLFVFAIIALTLPEVYFEPEARAEAMGVSAVISGFAFWYVYHRRTVRAFFLSVSEHTA